MSYNEALKQFDTDCWAAMEAITSTNEIEVSEVDEFTASLESAFEEASKYDEVEEAVSALESALAEFDENFDMALESDIFAEIDDFLNDM